MVCTLVIYWNEKSSKNKHTEVISYRSTDYPHLTKARSIAWKSHRTLSWLTMAHYRSGRCRFQYWHGVDIFNWYDDVIKWKHLPRNWPFVRKIHGSPVNFPHKGQWRGALMFSLIYAWINDWVNNREAGDLRRQHGHYDVIVMMWCNFCRCLYHYRAVDIAYKLPKKLILVLVFLTSTQYLSIETMPFFFRS